MTKENPTYLERGVKVYISKEEIEVMKQKPGFMEIECYPDLYKEIALPNELGRCLQFRFFPLEKIKE